MTIKLRKAEKRWELMQPDNEQVRSISQKFGISEILATVLVNRGVSTIEDAQGYLSPGLATLCNPMLMKDMDKAVNRIAQAIRKCENIGIYGDMDADGSGASAILKRFFSDLLYDKVTTYIPNRFKHGYGLHEECIDELIKQGAQIIITVDVGIGAIKAAAYAKRAGVDLIITDHHEAPEVLPEAIAVVNPKRKDCPFPFKSLAGAGVAFYLIIALRKALRDQGYFRLFKEPDIRDYLDIVSLSTVGDLVSLTGENRKLVKHGIELINTAPSTGIKALMDVAGADMVSATDIAFMLAPRINAAGRLDTANHALELLSTNSAPEAGQLAELLDQLNSRRKSLEEHTIIEALRILKDNESLWGKKTIVLASNEFHAGTHGIAASKLVEMFNKPTILIAVDDEKRIGKGSCRSIKGFDIHTGLASCSSMLNGFGGHTAAAGLTIDIERIQEFADAFEAYAQNELTDEDMQATIEVDMELKADKVTMQLHRELLAMEPVGMGNRQAVFMLSGMIVKERKILKEKHLKLKLCAGGKDIDAIGFNLADFGAHDVVDVVFNLDVNEWRGNRNIQLKLKDIRRAH